LFLAQEYDILKHWFDLFTFQKLKYNIYPDDIYNIDEKGCMLRVIRKPRVIVGRSERKLDMT
jgi:hypothetical protein